MDGAAVVVSHGDTVVVGTIVVVTGGYVVSQPQPSDISFFFSCYSTALIPLTT